MSRSRNTDPFKVRERRGEVGHFFPDRFDGEFTDRSIGGRGEGDRGFWGPRTTSQHRKGRKTDKRRGNKAVRRGVTHLYKTKTVDMEIYYW